MDDLDGGAERGSDDGYEPLDARVTAAPSRRWRLPVAVMGVGLAAVIGGAAAAVILNVRGSGDEEPSASPRPSVALIDPSASAELAPIVTVGPTATAEPSETASPSASPSPTPTRSPTPSPSPTASPSPSPPPPRFEIDDWVAVIGDVAPAFHEPDAGGRLAGELPRGTEGIVIDGPVEADGFTFYYVQVGRTAGRECGWRAPGPWTSFDQVCRLSNGWVPVQMMGPRLGAFEPSCPRTPGTIGELAALSAATRLYCLGGTELTLKAYLPDAELRACTFSGPIEPEWLWCEPLWMQGEEGRAHGDIPEIGTYVHPSLGPCDYSEQTLSDECPFVAFVGEFFTITGMYDHPETPSCRNTDLHESLAWHAKYAPFRCRSTFVITEYVAPAP